MKESKIPRECPRFETCSVNNCPLDPRYPGLSTIKGDPETKCPVKKSIRIRIGSQHPELQYHGHTVGEYSALQRYEMLPEPEKQKLAAMGAKNLAEIHVNKEVKTP